MRQIDKLRIKSFFSRTYPCRNKDVLKSMPSLSYMHTNKTLVTHSMQDKMVHHLQHKILPTKGYHNTCSKYLWLLKSMTCA